MIESDRSHMMRTLRRPGSFQIPSLEATYV
eukprot:SAG22_NODE_14089_length_385_cov_0.541958_1_plen_29_part_10